MVSICWTCGGTGEYLEGNEKRAVECFGCEQLRKVDERD